VTLLLYHGTWRIYETLDTETMVLIFQRLVSVPLSGEKRGNDRVFIPGQMEDERSREVELVRFYCPASTEIWEFCYG
jgi:hypothetical protein